MIFEGGSMGLIANLKKMFNKNIECGDELNGHFIYLYPSGNRIVHVNSHIIVGDNYYAVFVCNDKVCDILPSGKHKISGAVLPKTFGKLKLDKPNKAGNYPKKFKADVYYVFKSIMEQQQFCSDNQFFKKSSHFGKVKGYSEGLCDVQVLDPEKLMKVLLIDRFYIRNKQGIELTLGLVGNEVNKMIEQAKFGFTEIILKPDILNEYLNPAINEKVDALGIRIYNLELTSFKLSRSLQKRVALFLSERKQVNDEFEQAGIKYLPEQVVPNKVVVSEMKESNNNETLQGQAPMQSQTPQNNNYSSANQSAPQIIRRGGLSVQQPESKPEFNTPLNSSEIFAGATKKVCKFCGETIDEKFAFCPKCGFKQ